MMHGHGKSDPNIVCASQLTRSGGLKSHSAGEGADISVSEVPTDAVPGVGSGHGSLERSQSKRLRIGIIEWRRRADPKGPVGGGRPRAVWQVERRGNGGVSASHSGTARVAFVHFHSLRPRDMPISWLNHTPRVVAVYA